MHQLLPDAIGSAIHRALESYARFSAQDVPDDAKGFAAHHTACKAAVAHVDYLLRLSRWTGKDESNEADNLTALLGEAEDEVRRYQEDDNASV